MRILIIVCIVMFILALANWGQSQGYFDWLLKLFGKKSSDEKSVNNRGSASAGTSGVSGFSGSNSNGGVVINNSAFAFDEDYAYDDDSDYFDEF